MSVGEVNLRRDGGGKRYGPFYQQRLLPTPLQKCPDKFVGPAAAGRADVTDVPGGKGAVANVCLTSSNGETLLRLSRGREGRTGVIGEAVFWMRPGSLFKGISTAASVKPEACSEGWSQTLFVGSPNCVKTFFLMPLLFLTDSLFVVSRVVHFESSLFKSGNAC